MDVLSSSDGDDKIAWYKNLGGGIFAAGQWIKCGNKPAEIPGVW